MAVDQVPEHDRVLRSTMERTGVDAARGPVQLIGRDVCMPGEQVVGIGCPQSLIFAKKMAMRDRNSLASQFHLTTPAQADRIFRLVDGRLNLVGTSQVVVAEDKVTRKQTAK